MSAKWTLAIREIDVVVYCVAMFTHNKGIHFLRRKPVAIVDDAEFIDQLFDSFIGFSRSSFHSNSISVPFTARQTKEM